MRVLRTFTQVNIFAPGRIWRSDAYRRDIRDMRRIQVNIFAPEDLAFRLSNWLEPGAAAVEGGLDAVTVPTLLVVGARDRLLPSVDEAARLSARLPEAARRGT